jgi:hypothetical protein
MSEKRQNKFLHPVFGLFSVLYIFSMIVPAYCIPEHYMDEIINENKFGFRFGDFVQGYEALWAALITIFKSPVAFLGSLANFAVITVWILYLTKISDDLKFLKNTLAVITMVSVLIWPIALKSGLLPGYYIWALSSIFISFSFAAMKNQKELPEEIVLDEDFNSDED